MWSLGRTAFPCVAVLTLVLLLLPGRPAAAADPDDTPTEPASPVGASGGWLGARDRLARRGIDVTLLLQGDPSVNLSGGLRRGLAVRVPVQATVDIDTERLIGWRGGRLHAGVQALEGTNASERLVGDLQGFNNVDAQRLRQVSELWLEQSLLGERLRLKIGKADANADFARVEASGDFLNSSAGFSPTILGLPSYPDPATSISLFARARPWLSLGAGIYDGATHEGCHGRTGNRGVSTFFGPPGAYFVVGEAGLRYSVGDRPGRLSVGTWRHTGTFEGLDGPTHRGTSGLYAVLEQRLRREPGDGSQGLDLFVQLGSSDPRTAEVDQHLSVGVSATGLFRGRDRDVVGVMVTSVGRSALSASAVVRRHESAVEVYYGLSLRPWLMVKPDLQYIVNPGAADAPDALVATVRVTVAF